MNELLVSTATIVNEGVTHAVNDLLGSALKAVTLLAVSGLTYGIKLWVNSMKSSWKRQLAFRAVAFAQQRITGNEEKRKAAAAKIHQRLPRISEDEINDLLEEAVVTLKAGLK